MAHGDILHPLNIDDVVEVAIDIDGVGTDPTTVMEYFQHRASGVGIGRLRRSGGVRL